MHFIGQATWLKIQTKKIECYLKSVLVSRFQGSIIPEPDQQTPLVLAGIQEE